MDVSRDHVTQMTIELTMGIPKEESEIANLSEAHAKRWDVIKAAFEKTTTAELGALQSQSQGTGLG